MTNEPLQGKKCYSKPEKSCIDLSEGFTSLKIAALVSTNITERLLRCFPLWGKFENWLEQILFSLVKLPLLVVRLHDYIFSN